MTANDRLYLAEHVPFLIVWGDRDPIIPMQHGYDAHAAVPKSRLELFEGSGHFPQLDDPYRFAELLAEFIAETEPAAHDASFLRERLLAGAAG